MSRELELALEMEEGREFAFGRMRDVLRIDDDVEDEDELDAIWVEAAAGAIVRGTPNKLDDANGESAEVVGVCNAATAATAAVREARGDELDGGG